MEALLVRERYKIIRVLRRDGDFRAAEVVDIGNPERPTRLLNLYGGGLRLRWGGIYAQMRREECPVWHGGFLDGGTLAEVFDSARGVGLETLFPPEGDGNGEDRRDAEERAGRENRRSSEEHGKSGKLSSLLLSGEQWTPRERLEWTELFLAEAVALTNLPPEIGGAALLPENILFQEKEKKVSLRFLIPPVEGMDRGAVVRMTARTVETLLRRRSFSTEAERAFLDTVRTVRFPTVGALYAAWHRAREQIEREIAEQEKKNIAERALDAAKQFLGRQWAKLTRRKG